MKLEILTTPGCTECAKLKKILESLNLKYSIIDITKKPEILKKYPLMAAPGLVINGKLAFTGVPKEDELKKKLGV